MTIKITDKGRGFSVITRRLPFAPNPWSREPYDYILGTIQRRQCKPRHTHGKPIKWEYFWRVELDGTTKDFDDLEAAKAWATAVSTLTD